MEQEATEEEEEIWKRRLYAKESFTNDDDWEIHEELDEADDLIVSEPGKAIEKFEAILRSRPKSPRARYALLRSKMFLNRTAMDEGSRQILDEEIMGGFTALLRSG